MYKEIAAYILLSLLPATLFARQLTPDEAWARCGAEMARTAMKSHDATTAPVLTKTLADSLGNRCLYVFADRSDGMLCIVSADDCSTPLLAHDINPVEGDMPPAMAGWIEGYVSEISAAIAAGATADTPRTEAAALPEVAPLISTKWNQGNPYNLECPIYSGKEKCNTGCVATAAAQIMYKYKYPAKGTGSHSYTDDINGRSVTMSADFGATTYAWSSMTATYTSKSSTAAKNAVARLMSHLGVAFEMDYDYLNINQSAASLKDAALGLLKYFGYSKEVRYFERKYFSPDAWRAAVHAELAAGRPLLYEGNKNNAGHAFVCDGYKAGTDRFHFNWGWGGNGDGYYALSALKPNVTSGAGGGNYDYSDNQGALFGIRKPGNDDHHVAVVKTYGDLTGGRPMLRDDSKITLTMSNCEHTGFYNNVMFDGETSFIYGLLLTPVGGGEPMMLADLDDKVTLKSGYGYSYVNIPACGSAPVPQGDYTARLYAAIADDSRAPEWQPVLIPYGNTDMLNVHVGRHHVKVYNAHTTSAMLSATSMQCPAEVKIGDTFKLTATVGSKFAAYEGDISVSAIFESGRKYKLGTARNVNIAKGGSANLEIDCSTAHLDEGTATICLTNSQSTVLHEGQSVQVSYGRPELSVSRKEYPSSVLTGKPFVIRVWLLSDKAPFAGRLECLATGPDGVERTASSAPVAVEIKANNTGMIEFDMLPFETGGDYILRLRGVDNDVVIDLPDPLTIYYRELSIANLSLPELIERGKRNEFSFDLVLTGNIGHSGCMNYCIEYDDPALRYCEWTNYTRFSIEPGQPEHIEFYDYIGDDDLQPGPATISFFIGDDVYATEGEVIAGPYPVEVKGNEVSIDLVDAADGTLRLTYLTPHTATMHGAMAGDRIDIHDVSGRLMLTLAATTDNPLLDLSPLAPGIYILNSNGKNIKTILK